MRIFSIILGAIAIIHGLIHWMGFAADWHLGFLTEIPNKTTLLGGRLDLGTAGIRLFALLWLLAALGWIAGGLLLILSRQKWAEVMLAAALLSLTLAILDWNAAFRSAWIDIIFLIVLGFVFGFRLQPAPFPDFVGEPAYPTENIAIPPGLPAPVERFYHLEYPDGRMPVYHTAVLSGRGTMRIKGIKFPARMRFTHIAGQGYRHYMECTFYGIPILKANEYFLEGRGRLELPFGVTENEPTVDSAANQGLWAEMRSYPSSYLVDERTRWEAVDDQTAHLYVPWQDGEQEFTVRFDLNTGRMLGMETMRHRDAKSGLIRWETSSVLTPDPKGGPALELGTATWADEGTPWLVFLIEDAVYNADVSAYIHQRGP